MDTMAYIAVSFLVIPLIIIIINILMPKQTAERYALWSAGLCAVIQMVSSGILFFMLMAQKIYEYEFALLWDINKIGSERFSVTKLALVILFCVGFVSFVSVLVANQTVGRRRTFYVNLLMTLILGMNGMIIVTDLFSLYVFLEIAGISGFVLIAMFQSKTGLEGAFKYLVMSSLASMFILVGLSLIFMQTGSLQFSKINMNLISGLDQTHPVYIYLALILLISGFAIKTGAVPFHSWLPDAHQSADTAVSVLLSGIVIKVAGIYGFVVLSDLFGNVHAVNITLAAIGIASIFAGALYALKQDHFKRIVAYSSVSQMGYILLGISTGSTLGLLGAVLHIFNHATFKSLLFSNAAALHEQVGTLDINELGGLQKKMPITGASSISAFLSTAGIPPFAGFWSKLLIIMALWARDWRILSGIALFSSIFTAAYFLRMQKKVFFGKLPDKFKEVKEAGGSIKFVQVMLTVVIIVVGVLFPAALLFLRGKGII